MTRPGHDPDAGQGESADPRVARLLRWYPPTWRERYADEFLAMVEDTLDWRARDGARAAGGRGPEGMRAARDLRVDRSR